MSYVLPDYSGKLSPYGYFDQSRILILEEKYSHIIGITAKEGRLKFGDKEDTFCDARFHAVYNLGKRGDSLLMQLSKLTIFAKSEMQQVKKLCYFFWRVFIISFLFRLKLIHLLGTIHTSNIRKCVLFFNQICYLS